MAKLSTARAKALAAKRGAKTETRQTTKDAIWCEGYEDYAPGAVMNHPYVGDEATAYSEGWRAASELKPAHKPASAQEASAATPTPIEPETRADGQAGPVSVDYTGIEARIVAQTMVNNPEFAEKVLSKYSELRKSATYGGKLSDNLKQSAPYTMAEYTMGHAAPGDPVSRKELERIMRPSAKTTFKAWYAAVRKCRREMGEHAAHNSQHDGLGLIYRGKVFMLAEWRGITRKQAKPAARAELFSRFAEIRNTQGKAARHSA